MEVGLGQVRSKMGVGVVSLARAGLEKGSRFRLEGFAANDLSQMDVTAAAALRHPNGLFRSAELRPAVLCRTQTDLLSWSQVGGLLALVRHCHL